MGEGRSSGLSFSRSGEGVGVSLFNLISSTMSSSVSSAQVWILSSNLVNSVRTSGVGPCSHSRERGMSSSTSKSSSSFDVAATLSVENPACLKQFVIVCGVTQFQAWLSI